MYAACAAFSPHNKRRRCKFARHIYLCSIAIVHDECQDRIGKYYGIIDRNVTRDKGCLVRRDVACSFGSRDTIIIIAFFTASSCRVLIFIFFFDAHLF